MNPFQKKSVDEQYQPLIDCFTSIRVTPFLGYLCRHRLLECMIQYLTRNNHRRLVADLEISASREAQTPGQLISIHTEREDVLEERAENKPKAIFLKSQVSTGLFTEFSTKQYSISFAVMS